MKRYAQHLHSRKQALKRLFRLLRPLDPRNPDVAVVRRVLLDDDLRSALRYVAGPPISEDDLGVLVTRTTARVSKAVLKRDDALTVGLLQLICTLSDVERFPWIRQNRPPRPYEIKQAVRATTALHAAQSMQTERRAYGRQIEKPFVNASLS